MKKNFFTNFTKMLFVTTFFVFIGFSGWGQVNLASVPSTITQDFNGLSSTAPVTWTDNTTPLAGWYSTTTTLNPNTGSTNSNNVYNFGTASATDRALGAISTATTHRFGMRIKNNSATAITSFDISFTGEQWRQNTAAQTLVFEYQVGSSVTSLTAGTWTAATSLDFVSPNTGVAGSLDGNLAANRTAKSATITVSVPAGSEIMLRWTKAGSNSHGLAIDDVSITANGSVPTPTVTITAQDPDAPTAVNWNIGTNSNQFYWASISPTIAAATLSSVTANMTGTFVAADIPTNGIKLYYSSDFTFAPAGDVLLGSQSSAKSGATENITWSGLTQSIAQNATGYIYATANIDAGATAGHTLAGSFTSNTNIVFNPAATYSGSNSYGATADKTFISATPSITLANNGTQIVAANVNQGTNNLILSTFKLDVTTANATLTEADFLTGGNYQAADINGNGFKLWYNSSNAFGSATAIGSALGSTSTGSGDLLFFTSLSRAVNIGTGYFWVTANIASGATVGRTINITAIANADLTFSSGSKSGSASASGAQTIVVPIPDIAISSPAVAAGNVSQNSDNQIIYRTKFDVTTANATLTEVSYLVEGTYADADIKTNGFQLYYNTADNFGAATTLGAAQSSDLANTIGILTFSSLSQTITSGTSGYIWLTADISATATPGNTLIVAASINGDFNFGSGNKTGTQSAGGTQTISAPCPSTAFPFIENFVYSGALTSNCWAAHSGGGTNPITVASSTISYPGYLSSGVGNEVTLTTSGEDDNQTFPAQTAGSVYASFLVNITSATTTGDYFFHLGQTIVGSTFRGRVFVKRDASNNLAFGIAQSTTTVNYSAYSYALNTTYLIVLKYDIVSGITNDVASIYINPALNAAIPASGWLTNTDAAGTDLTEVGSVALRQGSSSNAPALILDGIRISTSWADIVGSLPTFTGTGNWTEVARWSTGAVPGSSASIIIDGAATITDARTVADITINSTRSLTIASGGALTASGTTTLNGAQSLIINTEGSFIDNGMSYVGGGSAKVEKTLAVARWWYIGSPLSSNITASAAFGALGGATGVGKRMYYYTEGLNGTYTSLTDAYDLSTTQLQGYVFKNYSGLTNVDFTGTLNTGTIARTNLTRGGTSFLGYTLICNPYPSAVDLGIWDGITSTTSTGITLSNLETTVWYNNGSGFSTYNWASGDGQGTPQAQSKVPAMQAFWVRVNTAPGSFSIPNATRTHSSQAFYKITSTSNVFRMNISDGTHTDEAVVGFYPNALNILENYDSEKMFYTNEDVPQTYTLTSDAIETAINGQAELTLNEERIIPLGFATPVSGTFTFAATNLTDFDASISIYLEDLQLGIVQDLRQNASYTFSSGIVDNASRFNLHFGGLLTDISTSAENHVYVYADENNVYVNTAEKCTMEIYNVLGEKIMSQQLENGLNKIQLNVVKGIYVVKVQNSAIAVNKKIYIGQ